MPRALLAPAVKVRETALRGLRDIKQARFDRLDGIITEFEDGLINPTLWRAEA